MEAHDGISSRIVEKAGFEGVWASSLTLASVLGKRDANEASWTELIALAGRIADSVTIPVLLDGDNACGHFNTARQMVAGCCRRGIAGVAIEDKVFPKRNSLRGGSVPLLPTNVFEGMIRAGKDSQISDDFCLVARTEALISGGTVSETLDRADAYLRAGADAVLVHSRSHDGRDIEAFMEKWGRRGPVVLVPTTYHRIGVGQLFDSGANLIVWANHLLRASVRAMLGAADQVRQRRTVAELGSTIASLEELFELMDYDELEDASRKYG